ncbi:MAG: hypothetical protein JWP44_1483 [Mucilaginibacter sp.]|nr:hypothetical protein [Mucilaginibacter sp.]
MVSVEEILGYLKGNFKLMLIEFKKVQLCMLMVNNRV